MSNLAKQERDRTSLFAEIDGQRISDEDFRFISANVQARAGISLGSNKIAMVTRRIWSRIRECGMSQFAEYKKRLEDPGSEEWLHLVNILTTNHSAFFREAHHFRLLAEFAQRRAANGGGAFSVWSSACATGEEPYSIAITLAHYLPDFPSPRVEILATDIDTIALAAAAKAVYPQGRVQNIPRFARADFVPADGTNITVKPAIRGAVTFRPHNLIQEDWSGIGDFDVVFCRNALIYFTAADQRKVVERLVRKLRPNGLLFLGHSEAIPADELGLRRAGVPTAYSKLA